jgi:uncharacterized protein YhdP
MIILRYFLRVIRTLLAMILLLPTLYIGLLYMGVSPLNTVLPYVPIEYTKKLGVGVISEQIDRGIYRLSATQVNLSGGHQFRRVSLENNLGLWLLGYKTPAASLLIEGGTVAFTEQKAGLMLAGLPITTRVQSVENQGLAIPHWLSGVQISFSDLTSYVVETQEKLGVILNGSAFLQDGTLYINVADRQNTLDATMMLSATFFDGVIRGERETLSALLSRTPLDRYQHYNDPKWDVTGWLAVSVYAAFIEKDFLVNVDFYDVYGALVPVKNLPVDSISGRLTVGSGQENLIEAALVGQIYGHPVAVEFSGDGQSLHLSAKGKQDVQRLNGWLVSPFMDDLTGETDFQVDLVLGEEDTLVVKSDLLGIESRIPYPFNKTHDEKAKFIYSMNFTRPNTFVHFNDHNIKLFHDAGRVVKVAVGLNQLTPKDFNSGIAIVGTLDRVDIRNVLDYLKTKQLALSDDGIVETNPLQLDQLRLHADAVSYGKVTVTNADFSLLLDTHQHDYQIEIMSDQIEGKVLVDLKDGDYIADIKRVDYTFTGVETAALSQQEGDFDYHLLKHGKVRIQDITINDEHLSDVMIETESTEDLVFKIYSQYESTHLSLRLRYDFDLNLTELTAYDDKGAFYGDNIYDLVKRTNPKSPVKSGEFKGDVNMTWSGLPHQFSSRHLSGSLDYMMHGIKVEGLKEDFMSMKIFNILNLESAFKLLAFDFDQLSKRKLSFDKMDIAYRIKHGVMETKRFTITGDDANIEVSGGLNLPERTINQRVDVVVPVTDKISGLALLAGATPQTAGIVFLVDKLLGKKLNKIFEAKFKLVGDWDDVKLEKR